MRPQALGRKCRVLVIAASGIEWEVIGMSDAKAYYHPGFLFASIDAKRVAQDTTPLRKIAFRVFPDFEILDLCGPLDVFVYADRWLRYSGRVNEPGYEVQVIAATPGLIKTKCGLQILATHGCADVLDGLDTLIVAGGEGVAQACAEPALVA